MQRLRSVLLVFAAGGCAMGAQITTSQTGDVSYLLQGTGGSLSVIQSNTGTSSLTVNDSLGTPSFTFSSGANDLAYSLSALTNVGDHLHAIVDTTSETTTITVTGGSISLTIDPNFSFNLTMAGPSLASQSVTLGLEEFNAQTGQWDQLTGVTISQSTSAGPDTATCTDCVSTRMLTISNSTAEFRLHSHFDFTLDGGAVIAAVPEPGTFGLLAIPLVVAWAARRKREFHRAAGQ